MRDDIIRGVADYYSGKVREHGATHKGVDWSTEESQRTRFAQLVRVCPSGRRFSLNDYGCGYGALAEYLEELGLDADYCGFDISEPMVTEARYRLGDNPNARFTTSAADLTVADCTVASGIFNVKAADVTEDEWQEYVVETVRAMAGLSRAGVAWNMLTSYSDAELMRPDLHYADPRFWFDFCKRELSRQVAVLHDYGLYEFTVLVRLEGGA